jgi:NAD+ synthase
MSPPDRLAIAIAQLNPIVGDIVGNAGKARAARARAAAEGAELIVFSELFICGYPPEDLVLKPALQAACRGAIETLAGDTADGGPAMLIGTPWIEADRLYNAVALLDAGRIAGLRFKVDLPNYGVFDEKRLFSPGPMPGPVNFRGVRLGVPICEDIWGPEPVECIAETGGEIILVPNGSPYRRGVIDERLSVAVARVKDAQLPLVYVNQVGGQDELVFDGASFVLDADLTPGAQLPAFREDIATVMFERGAKGWRSVGCWRSAGGHGSGPPVAALDTGDAADYAACVLGLRDYVDKNRFPGVVLGLSGGVDSALCAAIAVDALGASRVRSLMLPYRFTAKESLDDARAVATALRIHYDVLPIAPAIEGLEKTLAPLTAGLSRDVTEENLQARARGVILMAISNKFGLMVVTTGNKSEMSAGYATLYGDMNGGFNPLKDLYKTEVYRLSRLRNAWRPPGALGPAGPVIPDNVLVRAPTAELRENQKDQDSLPPYEVLDAVLERLVEREEPVSAIVDAGFDRDMVMRIERMLTLAEYKRRQAAPGVKVTLRNFGRDRRYPIVNRFRDPGAVVPATATAAPRGIAASSEAADF